MCEREIEGSRMGLPPLEYIECYLDSPGFREIIALYEKELEENAVHVKSLVKECRHMIQATEGRCTFNTERRLLGLASSCACVGYLGEPWP